MLDGLRTSHPGVVDRSLNKSTNSISGSAGSSSLTSRAIDEDQACRIGYPTPTGTGCNVTHDFVGNLVKMPTRAGTRTLGYFLSGQVQKIRDGLNTATFRYDPFGAVQELDVAGTSSDTRRDRHYGGMIEVRNQTVGGVTSSFISRSIPGPGGLLASLRGKTSSSWVFSFGDARGLRFTTDATGNFLQDVAYQPFGEATSTGQSPGSPLYSTDQWNGGDALAAFGLSHLGARLYDPVIGRFLSRDPLTIARTASTSNPYAFAANDPVNHSDPSGLDWQQGCIGIECQGLQWQLPFDWLGGGGGSGGGARNPAGGRPAPPPAVAPPMTGDASGAMWPAWTSPSTWERFTGGVSSAAHSFGHGWMWTWGHFDRGLHAAVNFVDDHAGAFVAGGAFVVTAFTEPEVLVAQLFTGATAPIAAWFSAEEPALVDGVAVGAEEASTLEEVAATGEESGSDLVNLASPQRTTHILTGDGTGGGHLWPGAPGKTPFPADWSACRIMNEVSDIATDPALGWVQQTGRAGSWFTRSGDPSRFIVIGERGGISIKVVLEPMGEGIITSHPMPTP